MAVVKKQRDQLFDLTVWPKPRAIKALFEMHCLKCIVVGTPEHCQHASRCLGPCPRSKLEKTLLTQLLAVNNVNFTFGAPLGMVTLWRTLEWDLKSKII